METAPDSQFRILYVEDDDDIRELVSGHLRALGHDVTEADSAELGLELLGQERYGLVLSDYHLPGKSGTWMLGEAQALGYLADTSVLLMTAAVRVENGASWKLLQKPVDMQTLDRAVSSASSEHGQSAERGAPSPDQSGVREHPARVELVLYVHRASPVSKRCEAELATLLQGYRPDGYRLRVVDVSTEEGAELAAENAVAFVPTLLRRGVGTSRRLVGELKQRARVERMLRDAGLEKA